MQVPPFSLSTQIAELGPDLDLAVLKVLQSGQYIGGEEIQTFENAFARSVGVPYVVGCNSGTDALILALRALDIGEGDEVITCSFSFFATAEAVSAVGAKPVFVDVDSNNYLMDLRLVEQLITPATKAILPVHLFGCPVDMDQLLALAKNYGLKVIEDCAQATGAEWNGRSVGAWGDVGCFSFFPTKNLGAAGDAGAVTTHDQNLSKRIRELAVHGMPKRYLHSELGYNSRLDALQAAVLNVKLPKLPSWLDKRKEISARYQNLLEDLPCVQLPVYENSVSMFHAWNQFVVRVTSCPIDQNCSDKNLSSNNVGRDLGLPDSSCRDWLKEKLQDEGINTIIYYPIPIHLQPAYKELGYGSGSLPVTESLCSQVLSLPIFPELSLEQQLKVVDALKQVLDNESSAKQVGLTV